MTDPVIAYLTKRGWKEYPDQFKPQTRRLYAAKTDREDLRDCESNLKPPSLSVRIYPPYPGFGSNYSYEVGICGEAGKTWVKLSADSLTSLADVKRGIALVRKAWTALK